MEKEKQKRFECQGSCNQRILESITFGCDLCHKKIFIELKPEDAKKVLKALGINL